jgi:hypothetical protein
VNVAADLAQFGADTDSEYLTKFHVPGLRKAGDFRAAAVMNSQGRSLVFNAGPQFPADWARQAAQAAGTQFEMRTGVVGEADLLAWLAPPQRSSR